MKSVEIHFFGFIYGELWNLQKPGYIYCILGFTKKFDQKSVKFDQKSVKFDQKSVKFDFYKKVYTETNYDNI